MGSMNFAVDFCQLAEVKFFAKAVVLYRVRRKSNKKMTFANWQKSTAKVTTAKFAFPISMEKALKFTRKSNKTYLIFRITIKSSF